ncbi:MAG: hypothetical protein COW42_07070 [Deltaproteobacteria bacterium CG17_big_fil_post_rev_8_21_14_2_50_63_7]|nr:MAG: hypothetical protein COW42_07070 [Deltaproteobacteria bacterium CG17_big_fil_post_rev_8_21_14_2_50_63_7]
MNSTVAFAHRHLPQLVLACAVSMVFSTCATSQPNFVPPRTNPVSVGFGPAAIAYDSPDYRKAFSLCSETILAQDQELQKAFASASCGSATEAAALRAVLTKLTRGPDRSWSLNTDRYRLNSHTAHWCSFAAFQSGNLEQAFLWSSELLVEPNTPPQTLAWVACTALHSNRHALGRELVRNLSISYPDDPLVRSLAAQLADTTQNSPAP